MNTENNTQLALIEQLTELNGLLNLFVNGDADTIVPTAAGPIKSIAGIARDLCRFRYVQKVIDHRLFGDMMADDTNIEDGMLIRIWGEDAAVNGLYKKLGDASYAKVSYADVADLLPTA